MHQIELVDTMLSQQFQLTAAEVGEALLGKDHKIRWELCCLFTDVHRLIENLLGLDKDTLPNALAKAHKGCQRLTARRYSRYFNF